MLLVPRAAWLLKREILWVPLLGWAIARFRPIAIDRKAGGTAVNQVVTQGRERLSAGLGVIIYPEGTRVAPGETRRFGMSGALLASQSGAPLVPIAHDSGYYWRRRGLLKRAGTIRSSSARRGPVVSSHARSTGTQALGGFNRHCARATAWVSTATVPEVQSSRRHYKFTLHIRGNVTVPGQPRQ